MKKILLGTTAIVAAGMIAAPSVDAAEKLKVSVGGYMEQWFGYTTADDQSSADYQGFANVSDAEIHFKGMTTLDNGISVGVNVQLEANSNPGDQIDESYLIVKGNFGEINLGSENSALYKMNYGPSDYGIGINSGDQTAWVPNSIGASGGFFRSPFGSTNVEPNRTNDSEKLTYYTPRVEGFQLGVSYIPESGQDDNGTVDRNSEVSDGYAIAANFKRDFDGFNVGLSAGYGAFTDGVAGAEDPSAYSFGATAGFGGFSLGGAYAASEGTTTGDEETGYTLGAAYATGPWGVSVNWFHGESDAITTAGVITNDGEHDTYSLNGKYALGPGVTAAATLGYTELSTKNTASAGNSDTDGTYFVVGMKVSF
ncbi:porin [Nisaea denitrificans]|uniref:porin n=1 Tax=Nisaea denitrificans TaxID=390877 RepID=UPI0004122A82|nr:porin [Nisaea denitrificans]